MKTSEKKAWIQPRTTCLKLIVSSLFFIASIPVATAQSTESRLRSALIDSSTVLIGMRIENHLLKKRAEFLEKANASLKEAHEQAIVTKILEGRTKDERIAILEKMYKAAIVSRNWERAVFLITIILTLVVPR